MTYSVIIPAYNEQRYIARCIEACLKHAPAELLEIIVVNNASTDATADIASRFEKVRVVDEPVKGLPRARQRGFLHARGDIIVSLDADTIMPAGWFQRMQKEFDRNPNVVSVSGPYRYYDVPAWKRMLVALYWGTCAAFTYAITGYMVVGGNVAVRRSALEKIGGFDTSISFYGEDTDIARRLSGVGKVRYSLQCWIDTSARRFHSEGMVWTTIVYAANYVWIALFHRPLSMEYKDIR